MRFLLRNWHIKLAAVGIATILYTGIVFSGSFREETWNGPVDIEAVRKPENTYLFADEALVVETVRYRIPATVIQRVTRESFQAVVDLSGYDMTRAGEPQRLPITVTAEDGIQVLDWSPRQATVRLDELATRELQVVVEPGELPAGFELGTPQVQPRTVEARGPRTALAEVLHAEARVTIDDSGIDVRRQVTLVAVDPDGEPVEPIDLTPALVTVDIPVRATQTNKTLPVEWRIEGSVAPGYFLESVSATPAVVTVRGDPRVLTELDSVPTQPIVIDGISASVTLAAELVLPEGVSLVGDAAVTLEVVVSADQGSRTFSVAVICTGAPDGGRCEPRVQQLSVTVAGPMSALAALTAAQATPTVSASGLGPGTHALEPTFTLPEGLEVLAVSPARVEVVVHAAPTPGPTPTPQPTATAAP